MKASKNFLRYIGILRDKVFTGPEIVHFHINNYCNLRCLYCWFHSPQVKRKPKPKEIGFEDFKRIIDEIEELGATMIRLSGDGEPTMHSKIKEMIHYIKNKKLKFSILTNCVFNKDIREILIDADEIFVNFSAPNKQVYNEIQSIASEIVFKNVIRNIHYLSIFGKGSVEVQYIINNRNYKYVYEMMKLASKLGVDSINFKIMDIVPHNKNLILSREEIEDFKTILEHCIREQRKLKIKSNISSICTIYSKPSFIRGGQKRDKYRGKDNVEKCFIGWYFANINLNGDVTPCCRMNHVIGNINKKGFREIWISEKSHKFRMDGKYFFKMNKGIWNDCSVCEWRKLNHKYLKGYQV